MQARCHQPWTRGWALSGRSCDMSGPGHPTARGQSAHAGMVSRNARPDAATQQQRPTCQPPRGRDTMHPMFKELFIEPDADDLPTEEDRRRRVRRSRRARSAMVIRPAARHRQHQPPP